MEDKVICNKSDLVNAADAIRSKLGVTDTYYVSELSSAIQGIETGGIVPSGTISITENGTVDVIQYASAEVNVSSTPNLQSKSVTYTSNGTNTITPDTGYDGISSVDVTVNVASGGGGGSGFKVTFPSTAKNWNKTRAARLALYDGTFVDMVNYSVIAGKTVNGVIGIQYAPNYGSEFYVPKMTIEKGAIAFRDSADIPNTKIEVAQAGESTPTPYGGAVGAFWWPIADTVISAIEMYNTD